MSLPLPIAEWRALLSEGPAVVMMAKADALALLDEIARLRAEVEALREGTDAPRASSGYRGVYAAKNRWLASIMRNGRTYRLGNFSTKDEAAQARLSAERRDWTPELPVSPNNVP